ncbi:MAG: VWA domain-containing protein [Victivallales bacterium]|nr:VWA domain-containing protein [Victivallales bacterium]
MYCSNPVWLLLGIPLLILLFLRPPSRRGLVVLRVLLLLTVLLALAGLSISRRSGEGTVIVLADRSFSMPADSDRQQREVCNILQKSCRRGQSLGVISFAAAPVIEKMPDAPGFDGFRAELDRNQSNLYLALKTALALAPDRIPTRMVILSDGSWTGPDPAEMFAVAASRGVPVDFRNLSRSGVHDLAIAGIQVPPTVPAGDFFPIGITIRAPAALEAEYVIRRNGKTYASGKVRLRNGDNPFFFRDRGLSPQVIRYDFRIRAPGNTDPRPENNRAEFLVKVDGCRPILLLTMSEHSGLGRLLRRSGIGVDVRRPGELGYSLAELAAYAGIIIENVPASRIGEYGLANMAALVKNGTVGLMMTGGKNSFALGGYFKSPLDEILPVSMELRQEHRKLSLAVVVALDRSGSMAASVGGGRTKMDLANMATLEVLQLLSPQDEFGVFAVDSAAHEVIPLCPVVQARDYRDRVRNIQSMGGGIFVYEALSRAAAMVSRATAGTRHIILFADAADSEQPGKYKELLQKCAAAGISVSVIGLGLPTDGDALLLKDIALRGGGQCFFSAEASELPRLFAQDTFTVARNTFIEARTKVELNAALRWLRPQGFSGTFEVGGFNLCYLRPQARAGAVTMDEYHAPIVAFWYAGVGRVLAYAGEVDGEFTAPFSRWPEAADLLLAMSRWTSGYGGAVLPDNMLLTQEQDHGVCRIWLHLDPERRHDPFRRTPEVLLLSGAPGKAPVSSHHLMRWETPDSLVLEIPLTGGETSLATVQIENLPPQVMAPAVLPYSPEFRPAPHREYRSSLEQLCRMTGGRERIDLAAIWQNLPEHRYWINLAPWLIVAAVLLLLLEVLERRTGAVGRFWARCRHPLRRAAATVPKMPMASSASVPESRAASKRGRRHGGRRRVKPERGAAPSEPPPEPSSAEDEDSALLAALNRVRRTTRKK